MLLLCNFQKGCLKQPNGFKYVVSTSKEKNLFQCLKKVAIKKKYFFSKRLKRPKKLKYTENIGPIKARF
jgi:hypothetical protein